MESQGATRSLTPAAATPEHDPCARLFGVRIAGGRYAFAARLVTEVVRMGPLTRLPGAPSFLPGVFAHRGEVIPVLDVAQLAGFGATPIGSSARAAIVRSDRWVVAVLSEAVDGLLELGGEQLEPPLADGGGMAAFLSGVGRDPQGPIAVIDLPRLIETARLRSVPG